MNGKSLATGSFFRHRCESSSNNFYRAIAASITSIVYGNPLANNNLDDILNRIFEVVHRVHNATTKDKHLDEFIPSMLLLPDWIAKWKRDARAFYDQYTALFEGFYEDARLNMVSATSQSSLAH